MKIDSIVDFHVVVLVEAGSRRGVRREELRLSSFHRHDKLDYAIRTCTSSSSSSRSLPFATAPKSESLKILGAKAVRALLEELRAAMIKRLRAPFLSGPFFPRVPTAAAEQPRVNALHIREFARAARELDLGAVTIPTKSAI